MEKEYLYHYTKLENLNSILKSGLFMTSDFSKANDYKERYEFLDKKEISEYRYVSFEKDDFDYNSFSNPVMWYHYANKHYGACLKIDKFMFEKVSKPITHFPIIYKDGVSYIDKQSDILEYLMYKRTKWEYESEYRYIYNKDIEYIPEFISCIHSIYYGAEVDDTKIKDSLKLNADVFTMYNNRTVNVFKMYVESKDGGLHCLDMYIKDKISNGLAR